MSLRPMSGKPVVLTSLPPGLLDDLPANEQEAISGAVGKPITLISYDEHGRAELQFEDKEGIIHSLFVNPSFIREL